MLHLILKKQCEHVDWLHIGQWQAVRYGNKALVAEED
jgi:hypothetical protein